MLSKDQLRDEHESGVFTERPQRLQGVREAVRQHCDLTVPRNIAAVRPWYDSHKHVMTRRLTTNTDDGDEDENTDEQPTDRGGE